MKIKITKKTHVALDLQRLAPRNPEAWNLMSMDGYYIIDIDDDVVKELTRLGANLQDPKSIEKVILQKIKENN